MIQYDATLADLFSKNLSAISREKAELDRLANQLEAQRRAKIEAEKNKEQAAEAETLRLEKLAEEKREEQHYRVVSLTFAIFYSGFLHHPFLP